jgi:hypothetical protein
MRIFKQHDFHEWAEDEGLTDELLKKAISELERGLIDANLGAGLYKKRIARSGRGKSGGYRTLIAFKENERVIFIYGFSKNERENITNNEKDVFKDLARYYLNLNDEELADLVKKKNLVEMIR